MRILAFAYACEPGKGSEPGAGWAWARMLGRLGETWVITRENNRTAIETALPSTPERDTLHVAYVDLPRWARVWKRGRTGIRVYYLLWQMAALRAARRMHRERPFDVVWHLTLANVWMGSTAALVGPPFIYGPVGGGRGVPWRLLPILGVRGVSFEMLRATALAVGRYLNPLARISWRRAALVLAQNPQTLEWLPRRHRPKTEVFPNVVLDGIAPRNGGGRGDRAPTAVYAGELLPLKGVALAIRAVGMLPGWRLLIVGSGSDRARLERMARKHRVSQRVEFRGWLPRPALHQLMREECDVLVFPSLRDQGAPPWIVAEALACGLPVVCIDRAAAPAGGCRVVAPSRPGRTARELASAVRVAHAAPFSPPRFDLDARHEMLGALLARRDPLWAVPSRGPARDRRG